MIVDTSFVLDVMNDDPGALETVARLDDEGVIQRVPAMAVYELSVGVGYTERTEEETAKIDAVLGSHPVVETTARIARKAGRIDGRLRRAGTRIDAGDATIGATGLVLDEPVLTGNPAHFRRIPDLDVETY